MEKLLNKQSLPQWVDKLKSHKLFIPQLKENLCTLEEAETISADNLLSEQPIQSAKKLIFPQQETFFEYTANGDGIQLKETLPKETKSVIFAVKPCDGKAVSLTDKVFGGEFHDNYYWQRREQTLLIGLACNTPPSANCFCTSVEGSPFSTEGLDILMIDLKSKYYVEGLTEKGRDLMNLAPELFKPVQDSDRQARKQLQVAAEKKIPRKVNQVKKVPGILAKMFDSPFWNEESQSCLRCGICTYLCPTCHCFDISDELVSNSPLEGKRVRTWDTCQFPDFTMHSSGHNPRPSKGSRLRQRILHKYQYFVEWFSHYQCTGCGRCVSKCPVGIDIIEVLNKVSQNESE